MRIGLVKQGFILHSYDLFLALNLISLQPNGAFMWVYLFADFLKGLYEQSNLCLILQCFVKCLDDRKIRFVTLISLNL